MDELVTALKKIAEELKHSNDMNREWLQWNYNNKKEAEDHAEEVNKIRDKLRNQIRKQNADPDDWWKQGEIEECEE